MGQQRMSLELGPPRRHVSSGAGGVAGVQQPVAVPRMNTLVPQWYGFRARYMFLYRDGGSRAQGQVCGQRTGIGARTDLQGPGDVDLGDTWRLTSSTELPLRAMVPARGAGECTHTKTRQRSAQPLPVLHVSRRIIFSKARILEPFLYYGRGSEPGTGRTRGFEKD